MTVINLKCRYYRKVIPQGYSEETVVLPSEHTSFLIIDVYGIGFDPECGYGEVSELYQRGIDLYRDTVVDFIVPARDAARNFGFPIIYLTNYLAPSTTVENEWRKMSLRTCGVDVIKEWKEPNNIFKYSKVIAPKVGDFVIKKQHYSGFFETHLDSLLKELGTHNLIVVGFDADLCLRGTVIDALYRNYQVVVLRDCTCTGEYPETEVERWNNFLSIRFIESNIGYTSTANDFIQACKLSQ
jgi:nicotinamidase-related amidase